MEEPISGFFLVDKPLNWTSFQAVNKIKHLFRHHRKTKIRIGHAGTLDPLASGLLIVCYGKMTKQIFKFQEMEKTYTGVIQLGGTTPSYDLETEIDQIFPTDHITKKMVETSAANMTGTILQRPPVFSAKKIEGKRAYDVARSGGSPKVKLNEVNIYSFNITDMKQMQVFFEIRCSKGTYIRSIAHDLGKDLDSGGHLISLRRTAIGIYHINDAEDLKTIEERIISADF